MCACVRNVFTVRSRDFCPDLLYAPILPAMLPSDRLSSTRNLMVNVLSCRDLTHRNATPRIATSRGANTTPSACAQPWDWSHADVMVGYKDTLARRHGGGGAAALESHGSVDMQHANTHG